MVLEFPTSRNDWKLDAVGLLAVIGETTTETCVEPMTASYLCLLPRLIPAPQALIRPNRRLALAGVNANVIGVHSGMAMPQLSYVANQLCQIAILPPFSVRVLQVKHHGDNNHDPTTGIESGPGPARPLRRMSTFATIVENYTPPQPIMKPKNVAPHSILSIASCLWTIGLLVWAIVIGDGPATLAIILLAVATTLFCAASLWSLPPRRMSGTSRPGDVVIRTKDWRSSPITSGFGSSVGGGTVIFMVAVILMGNSTWTMQAALAATYLLLNAVYWFVSPLPATTHWEFPSYEIYDITPPDIKYNCIYSSDATPSFTGALWKAILETKKVGWVRRSAATPETAAWDNWLTLAEMNALEGNRRWDAVTKRHEIGEL